MMTEERIREVLALVLASGPGEDVAWYEGYVQAMQDVLAGEVLSDGEEDDSDEDGADFR